MNIIEKLKALTKKHNFIISAILIFMVLIFSLINSNFIKPYNLLSMAQTLVPYAILTLGILFVIGSNNTDLSMGSICIASCVIPCSTWKEDIWVTYQYCTDASRKHHRS